MIEKHLSNLRIHLIQIANSFISEISEDNSILALDEGDSVVPEAVCNHHLIELLSQLNPAIFMHYCESLFKWLADPSNGYSQHPFTLDSYTNFCPRNSDINEIFSTNITEHQQVDGAIPVYTAFVEGGDFFSTLWGTKILLNYDKRKFQNEIHLAIDYLILKETVSARSLAQRGFLLFLLLKFQPSKYEQHINRLFEQIYLMANKIDFSGNPLTCVNDIYLLEDLIEYYIWSSNKDVLNIVEEKINILFQLDEDPKLPASFQKWSQYKPQQPYYQMLLKSGVVLAKYMHAVKEPLPGLELNAHLHGNYREIKYLGIKAEGELKRYKRQYDSIESDFQRYDNALKLMWEQSSSEYDTSIFLMMPFRSDMSYRVLTDEIKQVCEKLGFKAFRVDDDCRSPFDTLWDNIVLNMLGCKYGISVYVSEKTVDKMTDELRFFHNPNVALEYGFMKSRGKKVLILKDTNSKTPSDLQGFVWRPFDIMNPDMTVSIALEPWLKELKPEINNAT